MLLTLLLAITYSYLGYLGYSSLRQQNERERQQQMERFSTALDALLERAGDELARLAASMSTVTSTQQLQSRDLDELSSSAGVLSALTRIDYYTPDGTTLASWTSTAPPSTPARRRSPAAAGATDAPATRRASTAMPSARCTPTYPRSIATAARSR